MEISHYKRIAPDLFDLVDISSDQFNAAQYGLTSEAVQKNMHVLTPEGELRVGVDAFAHIWSRLKKYRWASEVIKAPIINTFAKVGYWGFATIRPLLPKKKRF